MFDTIKKILIEDLQINPGEITMDAELINDLGINSLELADLVLMCEEKFGIEIKDDDIHKFITVGDVVNYLSEVTGED
jgi:Acyl carrier protein